jgi:hypothetical protein
MQLILDQESFNVYVSSILVKIQDEAIVRSIKEFANNDIKLQNQMIILAKLLKKSYFGFPSKNPYVLSSMLVYISTICSDLKSEFLENDVELYEYFEKDVKKGKITEDKYIDFGNIIKNNRKITNFFENLTTNTIECSLKYNYLIIES